MSQKFSEYISRKKKLEREEPVISKTTVKNGSIEKEQYNWEDVDTVIRTYNTNGELPPILSPKLPFEYETVSGNGSDQSIIPQRLSPTLPSKYEELQSPPSRDQKLLGNKAEQLSFEKVEHFGVHSYRYVNSPNKRELLLTLYVPSYYKENKHLPKEKVVKNDKQSPAIGLGIKVKKKESQDLPSDGNDSDDKPLAKAKPLSQQEKLQRRKDELLDTAREKKHKGDSLRNEDPKLAIVYFIDCIIVYLVAFSYEDQGRRLAKKLYNDNPWMSLIAFVDNVLKLSMENGFDDIAGLCLQIRMVVYEHVCKIVSEFVQLDQARKRKKSYDKKEDLDAIKIIDERINNNVKNLLRYRELSKRGLIQSEEYLSIFKLQEQYPAIVSYFLQKKKSSNEDRDSVDPVRDSIQLPITHGVNIKEITAYSFRLIQQWCIKEDVGYPGWSFQ